LAAAEGEGASFEAADLSEARLVSATLRRGVWAGARFERANLSHADLSHGDFRSAVFRGAILTHASFREADVDAADFRGAIDAHRAHWAGAVGKPLGIHLGMFLDLGI